MLVPSAAPYREKGKQSGRTSMRKQTPTHIILPRPRLRQPSRPNNTSLTNRYAPIILYQNLRPNRTVYMPLEGCCGGDRVGPDLRETVPGGGPEHYGEEEGGGGADVGEGVDCGVEDGVVAGKVREVAGYGIGER